MPQAITVRASAFALVLFCSGVPGGAQDLAAPACSEPFLFASDTQEPMRVETLWLKTHENKRATAALFHELLAQRPTELFLLGDVVNLGRKQQRWSLVDTALAAARALGFNVHGVLGNHELMGRGLSGERNFQTRFPDHVRTGYWVRKDSMAVVLLNSNFSELSKADLRMQLEWYRALLATLDTAANVRAVLVCCHHSPYSDSRLVGSNKEVQAQFVAPFLNAAKTTLFISGHAHLFQHFVKGGKHFFVIGGGGGLHHPARRGRTEEVPLDPGYDPLFHYLTVRFCGDHLEVVSLHLQEDFSRFTVGHSWQVPLSGMP